MAISGWVLETLPKFRSLEEILHQAKSPQEARKTKPGTWAMVLRVGLAEVRVRGGGGGWTWTRGAGEQEHLQLLCFILFFSF